MKEIHTLAAVFLAVALCGSCVFAMNTMGPPVAGRSKGQLDIAGDYSDAELCIDFDFSSGTGPMPDFTKHEFEIETIGGRVGYGFTDSWEGFVSIGSVDAESSEHSEKHSADGMAYGFGTKVTLHEDRRSDWGALFQARWADLDGDASGPGWTGDLELDIMQLQVAVGPTYKLAWGSYIYGGPFWYYLDGEKDYREPGWFEQYDMSNCSEFGGYIGAYLNLGRNSALTVEWQLTEDDEAFGLRFLWNF